ncbi:MAG TPA: ligase-associated DNA damage response exonuclease [Flavitalea sp.]|nr:ligase-associated DNA damage response exonuclease [Flavitalea sp.]
MALIEFTDKGLFCRQGDFYIDPWKPVPRAVITHAHSDHARPGNESYLSHHHTKPLLRARLGEHHYESIEWGETVHMNGVKISLHPAGHMIGSSQVRVEYQDDIWVVSGDYKIENDGISGQFEALRCKKFITESTFGLPIYKWKTQVEIFQSIQQWVLANKDAGRTSVLTAYSLGKAQRLLPCLAAVSENIFVHGAIWNMHEALTTAGWKLPQVIRVTPDMPKETFKGSVVIAPSSAESSPWIKRFSPYAVGVCSGWMQVRGNVRRRNVDAGFPLSDHADWPGLLDAIHATGAEQVFVTHGFQAAFSRYLNEIGIPSAEVKTEYGMEDEGNTPVADENEITNQVDEQS